MKIRKYEPRDCKEMAQLFYETVHMINGKDYSKEQLGVWATGTVDLGAWNESFLKHHTVVAEEQGVIVGFGDMDGNYLDRLYVHKDYQGKGIATAITDQLEAYALKNLESKIITHASITARPFFEKRGYRVIKEQQVERRGILLTNFIMEKSFER